jgi:hypothetical protein
MAYISKEQVQAKRIKLKEINKKYGVKATFSGANTSSLNLTIQSGKIDFVENFIQKALDKSVVGYNTNFVHIYETKHIQVNHYHLDSRFSGEALEYLQEVYDLMKEDHYDNSDVQTDYFDTAWYNNIQIGKWNKGYEFVLN